MIKPDMPPRRRLNASQKRALQAATVSGFLQQYGRKAQRGIEPNDRRYSLDVEKALKRLKPEEFDLLIREDE